MRELLGDSVNIVNQIARDPGVTCNAFADYQRAITLDTNAGNKLCGTHCPYRPAGNKPTCGYMRHVTSQQPDTNKPTIHVCTHALAKSVADKHDIDVMIWDETPGHKQINITTEELSRAIDHLYGR